jgi:hypothetical protein
MKRTKARITMTEVSTLERPNQSQNLRSRRRQTIQFCTHLHSRSGLTWLFEGIFAWEVGRDYQIVLISNKRIRPSRLSTGTL